MDMKISKILGQLGQEARRKSWKNVDVQCWCDGDHHSPSYCFRICSVDAGEAMKTVSAKAADAALAGVVPQTWHVFIASTKIGLVYIG